ncbi:MAG: Cof-type HAD-IIB family hydrolase [Bacteroides sp.]|nr:Cof-type HAD-IIB family hydrolase [Bacteroides sp.]
MTKAIFFDIDGTLVSFKTHRIPASTREALKGLHNKGIKIFIATGRPWCLIDNLDGLEFDGYITVNGSYCFTADHQDIYKSCIPQEDIKRLINYHQTNPTPFVFVYDNEMFVTSVNDRVQAVSDLIEIPVPRVAPIEEAFGKEVLQTMGYFTAEEEKETDIFNKVLTHCEPMRWYPLFADIIARGNSKSTGIDKVLDYYGIDLKETMAFGDGGNDVPMLKHVATGVAMGNAEEHVKAVADYVTTSVDEDGVANALKHFRLI